MISTHFPSFSFSPCSGSMSVFWVIAMMGISFLKWCLASCVRETWTFWPQLVHFVLTDITLPCKSRHHAFRWLTHAIVFSRCIMDTQAGFFHQPFGACFFFWPIDWSSREPMGSNCAFVRASESLELDYISICSGFEKKCPPSKAGILDFLLLSPFFPWGNCPLFGCDPRMLLARWAWQLRGCGTHVSHLFLMQMRPWGLRPCVWSRHAFHCESKPDQLRKSPLKRERRRWHTRRGTQQNRVWKGMAEIFWEIAGTNKNNMDTQEQSQYTVIISCDFSMQMWMPSVRIIGCPVTLLL